MHSPRRNIRFATAFAGAVFVGFLLFVWPHLTSASREVPATVVTPTHTVASQANDSAPMRPGSPHCDVWRAGTVTVSVTGYVGPRDTSRGGGQTLAYWRKSFGGDEGDLTDPFFRNVHHVSLKPWETADPANTYVVIQFTAAASRPRS